MLPGYRLKARAVLEEKKRGEITCRQCSSCGVACRLGFDVPGKIKDITRILEAALFLVAACRGVDFLV